MWPEKCSKYHARIAHLSGHLNSTTSGENILFVVTIVGINVKREDGFYLDCKDALNLEAFQRILGPSYQLVVNEPNKMKVVDL